MKTTRTEKAVTNSLKIIKKAIKDDLSLSEASRQYQLGRNYVSDVKLRLIDNFNKNNVSKEAYNQFQLLMGRVEKIKKVSKRLALLKKV